MENKWYKKLTLTPLSLNTIGVDQSLFESVNTKIHKDDAMDIAHFLGTNSYILLNALFEPCEAPGGIKKNLSGN